jgi:hypothetical protein
MMREDIITPFQVSSATIEFHNYINKRDKDLTNYNKILETIEKYSLKDTDTISNFLCTDFYKPLHNAMIKGSNKTIRNVSDLALETRLLRHEFKDALINPNIEKSEMIISFLCDFSRELIAKGYQDWYRSLVA